VATRIWFKNTSADASAPILLRIVCLLVFLASSCLGQSTSANRTPVQAELLKAVDAGRVGAGDAVYAKVDLAWSNAVCKLREGAILKGRIVARTVWSKAAKSSDIALLFESGQCSGRDMKPLPLTLAAVLAPDPNNSLYNDQQSQPLNEATGLALGQQGSGSPMRSMTTAAATVMVEPPRNKPPQLVMPGQVVGIRNVTLVVGRGPEGSSVLTSEKHDLRLESGSRFVLVPSVPAPAAAAETRDDSSTGPAPSAANAVPSDVADETGMEEPDACLPPECNIALSANQLENGSTTAEFTMSVKQLGFVAAADHEMYDLDHAVAISYLGSNQLLFTFNPHVLVRRAGADSALPKLHIVRAALIDLPTRKVVRTTDWRVHDAKQYLWSMGRDRVLVHIGAELRIYGPNLKLERKLALNGPLAFVAVAPSGDYLAVGTVHERHSEVIHRELAEAEDREPEEDVEVQVLNPDFRTLTRVMRSSRSVLPVLSDNGEIRIPMIGKNRWRIAEYTWTDQRHVLKQVASTCRPEVTSLPPDLLFVTGCDRLADGKWYKILRADGKLVLKGDSPSTEQGHSACGIAGSSFFAVGVAELSKSLTISSAFHSSDLKHLRVSVYRAQDGKKIAAVTISDPLPTVQTFALSPDDRRLAILENEQIAFYSLPAPRN
jgi:hypothetical protein